MNGIYNHIEVKKNIAVSEVQQLRDGDFVFIKVLKDKGNGFYTVALGNKKFDCYSKILLEKNSIIKVKVSLQKDCIVFTPEKNVPLENFFKLSYDSLKNFSALDIFNNLFLSLGLPLDNISFNLISLLQQMGLNANPSILKKCYKIAQKFLGKQEEAVQVALMLWEKGIEPTENLILDILSLIDNQNNKNYAKDFFKQQNSNTEDSEKSDFFCELYGKSFSILENSSGILTLWNHIAPCNRHWLILPYEFHFSNDNENLNCYIGNIRFLLNQDKKNIEKLVVTSNNSTKTYTFVLYFNNKNISKIVYNIEPKISSKIEKKYTMKLQEIFSCENVCYENCAKEYGLLFDVKSNLNTVEMEVYV